MIVQVLYQDGLANRLNKVPCMEEDTFVNLFVETASKLQMKIATTGILKQGMDVHRTAKSNQDGFAHQNAFLSVGTA